MSATSNVTVSKMKTISSLIVSILLVDFRALAYDVVYNSFEQLNGTDLVDCQLRVTNINRTTRALNGTILVKTPITADYQVFLMIIVIALAIARMFLE